MSFRVEVWFHSLLLLSCLFVNDCQTEARGEDLRERLNDFLVGTCLECHDSGTETRLDIETLGGDLKQDSTRLAWEKIFHRIAAEEMPPPGDSSLSKADRKKVLDLLEVPLRQVSRARQLDVGRVPVRRLTRWEYQYALRDLLGIGGDLVKYFPSERTAGSFDVIGATQGMSSVHVKGLLKAAEKAIDEAIALNPEPNRSPRVLDYMRSPYIQMWVDRSVRRGGGTIFKTDKEVVTFRGENYIFRSDANGYTPPVMGLYRIRLKAAAYQPRSSITVSLKRQNDVQGESELFAAWDLTGTDFRDLETIQYLRPDDYFYVSADELDPSPDGKVIYNSQPASEFKGEGVRIREVSIEGPLESVWPPQRTRDLFPEVSWARQNQRRGLGFKPVLQHPPIEQLRLAVRSLANRVLARDLSDDEVESFTAVAHASIEAGRDWLESVKLAMRTVLVSPEFLYLGGDSGRLNDHDLARRLSLFLWCSVPDEELLRIVQQGRLSRPDVLAGQVERMLDDPKRDRMVASFLDQWLDLDQIDSTIPDTLLYPEYDGVLRRAMLGETREYFSHLIDSDLEVATLIDSDFTFLNRKLAEHYGIDGVEGEVMRLVSLDPRSVRGGILTHASIAKVTANGTVTSPVKRGSFVLANLVGTPPSPPPPTVGSIEPDTRGSATIRELLTQHQQDVLCASCHREIDPPGFALECFDPIGGFRKNYRLSKGVQRETNPGLRFLHPNYLIGPAVDASGVFEDGSEFQDIREFKLALLGSTDQVARHLLGRLIAFSTGAEIQFADMEEVERILGELKDEGYPLRRMIQQIVSSRIFLER